MTLISALCGNHGSLSSLLIGHARLGDELGTTNLGAGDLRSARVLVPFSTEVTLALLSLGAPLGASEGAVDGRRGRSSR